MINFCGHFAHLFSKKNVILSIFLTIFLLIITPHYYMKRNFWQNNYPIPIQILVPIYFEPAENNNPIALDIDNSALMLSSTIRNLTKIKEEFPQYDFQKNIWFTVPAMKRSFSFDVVSNGAKHILVEPVKNKVFQSLKINNVEMCSDSKPPIVFEFPLNKIIHFDVITKQDVKPINPLAAINYFAFGICLVGYFILSLFLSEKIYSVKKDNIVPKFYEFIKKYKVELFIFIGFLVFYLIVNSNVILHLNQFNWGNRSDSPLILNQIWTGVSKRFHPYYFIAFYPIFDFLIMITKNLFVSLGILYSVLAAFSVMFLYKAINIITKRPALAALFAGLLGISWAQIHLSQTFDMYIITGFYLCALLYLVQKELQSKSYNKMNMFWIILVAALTLGATIPNSITAAILVLPIFVIKKDFRVIAKSLAIFVILVLALTEIKGLTCSEMSWKHLFFKDTAKEVKTWVITDSSKIWKKYKAETLYSPIIIQHKKLPQTENIAQVFDYTILLMFIISLILLKKANKDKTYIGSYISVIVALSYNLVANYFWCPGLGLLFSLNHFALWFVMLGYSTDIITSAFKNKNLEYAICAVFLIYFGMILSANIEGSSVFNKPLIERSPIEYNVLRVRK